MHNARARNARRGLTVTVQHAIEQGAAPVARGRMYDIASGFVNDDERLVFIKNIQRHGFGSESAHIRRSFGWITTVADSSAGWRRRAGAPFICTRPASIQDRKSTRLNSSHQIISYAVFCLKKKKK